MKSALKNRLRQLLNALLYTFDRCCTCMYEGVFLFFIANRGGERKTRKNNREKSLGTNCVLLTWGARRGQRLIINRRAQSDKRWRLRLSKTTARGTSSSGSGGISLPAETHSGKSCSAISEFSGVAHYAKSRR